MRLTLVVVAACVCACGSVEKLKPDAAVDAVPDAAPPQVTSVTPTEGIVTTAVTINGSHFGTQQGSVTIGGVAATVTSWSDSAIALTIPDVLPGDVDVVVTAAGTSAPPAKFTVILPPAIYVDNGAAGSDTFDSVSAMAFDPTTGAVTQIGQPVTMGIVPSTYGGCSTSIWLNAHTRHLFASGNGKFAAYSIDPVTGALTPVTGSPFDAGGTRSFSVITNAAGTRLWITNYSSNNVGVFDLAADGTPTPVAGSPFTSPIATDTMTLSKDETLLFANSYGTTFTGFTVASTGAMTALGTTQGASGTGMMRRPGTDQLFIPTTTGTAAVWTADSTGAVTQLTGSPFTLAATTSTLQTGAFTPDGSRLYFAVFGGATIIGLNLAADGTPTAITGSPWTVTGTFSSCAAVSQDTHYIVAASKGTSSIGVFSLDSTGAPTAVTGSPFAFLPAGTAANGMAISF